MNMKKLARGLALMLTVGALAGCASKTGSDAAQEGDAAGTGEKTHIVIGVRGDGVDRLEVIRPRLEAAGYTIEAVSFDDSIQPNVALGEGSIDVNWYQHQPYLNSYNAENGTDFVMALPYTHYPFFGMYSDKYKSVEELPDGATIGLCNDATNQNRGLRMLESLGLISIDPSVEIATMYDVKENPKNLKFMEAEMSVLPQSLADVDAIVLAGAHMDNAGLDARSYIAESADAMDYGLGFVVRKEDADAKWLKDIVELSRCDELKAYFETLNGTMIAAF